MSATATRQTIQLPIDPGVIGLRGLSPERSRFELEYALERGSTANSVLFEAGDGAPAVLVHPPGVVYSAAFLPVLAEALPSSDAPLLGRASASTGRKAALYLSLIHISEPTRP